MSGPAPTYKENHMPSLSTRARDALAGALGFAALGLALAPSALADGPSDHGHDALRGLRDRTIASVIAANGDNNPYGLTVVPQSNGNLVAGDLLVTDFNNASGTAGAGTSVVQVNPVTGATDTVLSGISGLIGPVGIALNPLNDAVWLGDFGSSDGSTSNDLLIGAGGSPVVTFNPSTTSTPVSTGQQPTFDGVWGQGVSKVGTQVSFYYGTTGSGAGGAGGGEVWRIDPHPTGAPNGQPVHSTYVEVAQGLGDNATTGALPVTAVNAAGPQGFAYDSTTGVLYVSDDADNTIYALPGAATASGPVTAQVVLRGGPLNIPENIALDPATGDLLVANAGNNTLLAIDPSSGRVEGRRVLDRGAPGALFGLATATREDGSTVIYYVDDNSNTVHELAPPADGGDSASMADRGEARGMRTER